MKMWIQWSRFQEFGWFQNLKPCHEMDLASGYTAVKYEKNHPPFFFLMICYSEKTLKWTKGRSVEVWNHAFQSTIRLFTIRCLWLVLSVQGHCKSHLWPEEAKKPENTAIAQCRHRYSGRFMIQCRNDKALVKHRSILASSHWKRSFQHYFLWSTPQWSSDPVTSSWSLPPNHSSMVD